MKSRTIAVALAAALTLSACSDSTAPAAIQLTDAQAEDMMDALAAVGALAATSRQTAEYRQNATTQPFTLTIDETEPCPNGGTHRVQGTFTGNDAGTQASASITQGYTGCKATSGSGTLWTFDGAPNVKFDFNMTTDPTTGQFSLNGTQKGAIDVSSSAGSGRCAIDLTFSASGNEQTGAATATVSGLVCGRTITMTVTE